ncbi:MAG: two pore domain potassium channel family protein [Gammaproteobacteria bacterium]|jgi:hypothetical protein|nr:two pore domain potassium channel family protein [Gammaproteobacteria bacterium]MCH1550555.1 potassium channel family protein [Pseudomonadales bacterium]
MLENFLIGFSTMAACLILQAALVTTALRYYIGHSRRTESDQAWRTLIALVIIMTLLVLGNVAQLFIWAFVFVYLGEFETLKTAVYHSAVNFATLGYGDFIMSERYRLLGPLEAINGALMIGVSTAVLIASLQDALRKAIRAEHH